MQGKQIKERLEALIREASSVDRDLAKRLDELNRWVKPVKPGTLIAKRFVMFFILQMIEDSQIWLILQSLSSVEGRELYYQQMTPTEKYWYSVRFPKWLRSNDPKFYLWRQKLMSGAFTQDDEPVIRSMAGAIASSQGTVLQRYIADLSMATDIIVSGSMELPLCIQLTSVSEEHYQEKAQEWERTLREWEIERGLLLSYNPGADNFLNELVNVALDNSDNLRVGTYRITDL